jgi:hypothetical protein
VDQHFNCLEMLRIRTTADLPLQCACGILLEIWQSGGVLQTDKPLGKGEKFMIYLDGGQIEAEVQGYEEDTYGCYIRFEVHDPWFPASFQPSYLKESETHVS